MPTGVSRFAIAAAVIIVGAGAAGCKPKASSSAPPAPPPAAVAQPAVKNPHAFRGTIEKVEPDRKMITVNGEDVVGWMGPMTMVYELDKPDTITQLAVGDRISATVYDGDYKTLHDITVAAKSPAK